MKNEQQTEVDKKSPSKITIVVNFLTHVLLILPVLYLLLLAYRYLLFFDWHIICMALGACLFIIEGIYVISGEIYATRKYSRKQRVSLHWFFQVIGLVLTTIGFVVAYVNKDLKKKPHFFTLHGILGLVTFILMWLIAFFGFLTYNPQWFYPRVRPVLLKVVHGYTGIAFAVLLLVTAVNGMYSGHWWMKVGNDLGRLLILLSFAFAAVFVLIRPLIAVFARTRVLLKKKKIIEEPTTTTTTTATATTP